MGTTRQFFPLFLCSCIFSHVLFFPNEQSISEKNEEQRRLIPPYTPCAHPARVTLVPHDASCFATTLDLLHHNTRVVVCPNICEVVYCCCEVASLGTKVISSGTKVALLCTIVASSRTKVASLCTTVASSHTRVACSCNKVVSSGPKLLRRTPKLIIRVSELLHRAPKLLIHGVQQL